MSEISNNEASSYGALSQLADIDPEYEARKLEFNTWLFETYLGKQKSYVIFSEKYDKIMRVLRNELPFDHSFKHWVNKSKYCIIKSDGRDLLGIEIVDGVNKNVLPVAVADKFFDIIHTIHSVQRGHIVGDKTDKQIRERYDGIPRIMIKKFIKLCPICCCKKIQHSQPRLKPIRSDDFWARIQIDLIDMRHNKTEDYCWIAHVIDHFTKYHILWAQKQKTADEVYKGLKERVFAYFGLPLIFQSDNGIKEKVYDFA